MHVVARQISEREIVEGCLGVAVREMKSEKEGSKLKFHAPLFDLAEGIGVRSI